MDRYNMMELIFTGSKHHMKHHIFNYNYGFILEFGINYLILKKLLIIKIFIYFLYNFLISIIFFIFRFDRNKINYNIYITIIITKNNIIFI